MSGKWVEEHFVREVVPGCPPGGAEYVIYLRGRPKPKRRHGHLLGTIVSVCLVLFVLAVGALLAMS
jgi:hypothetical protein